MYNENTGDFPLEAKEVEYRERLVSCYPIHPEIFDRLYEDWATLERFQRTRGVLRLMAAVIHELWMGNDASLMIMPGSIPLDVPNVRDELTRHLSEGWNSLVDHEVDGKNSIPYLKDQSNPRYGGKLASRRVARAIMLGSAPSVRDQSVRGIEASRIRLGVVQPGENIANFNDALTTLVTSLAYLYTSPSNDRYWYDTRPTLRKTVADRATQILASDVEYEIETRMRTLRKEHPFVGLHICPPSSLDVPDEQTARLVILHPNDGYKATTPTASSPGITPNNAIKSVTNILNTRGNNPRIYRNMLAFIAPDQELMASLQHATKFYLAWKSIKNDSEDLNLDAAQNRETTNQLKRSDETVDAQIIETYRWLIIPYIDKSADLKTIIWDTILISGGKDGIITKAAKKMLQNEAIITRWAPAMLLMELNNLLWKDTDDIPVKKLWDYLSSYCYLPRLVDEDVLLQAIRTGLNSDEYFAFASGYDGTRYLDLKLNQYVGEIEKSGLLVKVAVAREQLASDESKRQAAGLGTGLFAHGTGGSSAPYKPVESDTAPPEVQEIVAPAAPKNRRFFMSADLDTTRINRDVQNYVEEIIQHLTSAPGAKVKVSLEVEVEADDGFSQQTVRTISENCRTLKVRDSGFEE
jgi:hypothetical protein